jgi:hypothetical protein
LLKATVEAEFFGEEWHPVSTKYTNSTENVAVRATMCGRDTIDLRHDPRPALHPPWPAVRINNNLLLWSSVSDPVVRQNSSLP